MMSIGHGALGAPTSMSGGSALGNVAVPKSQHKLNKLADKLAMKKQHPDTKKTEDKIDPAPTDENNPLDWDTVIGEKINHFSQLIRSEIVKIKLKNLRSKM